MDRTDDPDGQTEQFTGISSNTTSSGNAGLVIVDVEEVATILDGGRISSDTRSVGNAGNVLVEAGELLIDGLLAEELLVDGQNEVAFTGISSNTTYGRNSG